VVQVTLPKRGEGDMESTASGRSLVLRIPQRGGFAETPDLPRGILLLQVVPADETDPGVVRVELPVVPVEEEVAEAFRPLAPSPAASGAGQKRTALVVVTVLVILWIGFLVWLRVTGRG
jgi:hypothetical protein